MSEHKPNTKENTIFYFGLGFFTASIIGLLIIPEQIKNLDLDGWKEIIGAAIGVIGAYIIASIQITLDKQKTIHEKLNATQGAYIFFYNTIISTIRKIDKKGVDIITLSSSLELSESRSC